MISLFRRRSETRMPRASVVDDLYRKLARPKRILFVDDNEMLLDFMQKIVGARFCVEVVVASSVAAARERLAEGTFDAAILDIVLVNGSGIALYRDIAERWPWMSVAFLTGNVSDDYERRIRRIGPAHIFQKEYAADINFITHLFQSWHIHALQCEAPGNANPSPA